MSTVELIVVLLAGIGTAFLLISAIGIVRLPNVHARMHAVGKAATIGISSVLIATGIYYGGGYLWLMVLLVLLFFITSPIATTAIARAAYACEPENADFLHHNDMADPRYRQDEPVID